MLPVLHHHHVHLIDDKNLNRRQEVRVPAASSQRAVFTTMENGKRDSLLLLDTRPQSQRTSDDDIATVEFTEQFDCLPRHLHSQPEAIVDIPLERLDVILRVVRRVLHELVHGTLGERELGLETIEVLDSVGLGESREEVDPHEGRVAEGEEDEDFRAGEALVGSVARGSGGRGG